VNPDIDKHARTVTHAVRFLGTKSIAAVLLVAIAGVLLAMVKRLSDSKEWRRMKVEVQGVTFRKYSLKHPDV
jgi:hypothetical protein